MGKAVVLSIRPKWCEKIARGEKTIEVRKTRPKLETPFKCYIYCTLGKHLAFMQSHAGTNLIACMDVTAAIPVGGAIGNGKVIGEFTCDRIYELAPLNHAPDDVEQQACLTREEIVWYLKGVGYGWHILDLKIYDNPQELSKFRVEDKPAIKACKHRFRAGQPEYVARHGGWLQGGWGCMKNGEPEWCENCLTKPLTRPPQSWCYVEAMKDGN